MVSRPTVCLTTVLEPAASQVLADRAAFKSELQLSGSGDDAYIDRLLAQASAVVAQYCNRVFLVEHVLDEFWPERDPYPFQVPGGLANLQLSRWPIVTINGVTEAGMSLTDGVDFRGDLMRGQLLRLDANLYPTPWGTNDVAVDYTGGYATAPFDLADAVTRMARARWFARTRDPQVRSESISGVYDASYWFGAGPGSSGGLPPDITAILDNYRVPVTS